MRKALIDERGCKCEICGAEPNKESDLDAHEEWDYNTYKRPSRATVTGIKLLCPKCHSVVHFGLQVGLVQTGKLPPSVLVDIERHFCQVNRCGSAMFNIHVNRAIDEWERLNKRKTWRVDFSPYQGLIYRA